VSGPRAVGSERGRDDEGVGVALVMPSGADAVVTERILGKAGFVTRPFTDIASACAVFGTQFETLIITEEALTTGARAVLVDCLARQPAWSDVPVIVLAGSRGPSDVLSPQLEELTASANVTILERPVRIATLVTTLRAARRARRRQLEVRQYLEERRAAEETLRESERRLRLAREQAEEANRVKTEFLAVMSHELRTPLNAIGGYAQLLSLGIRGPLTDEQRRDLERIDRSQRHLLSLINDILNFAKLEAGRVDLEIEPVELRGVLGSLEALVMPLLRAKNIRYDDRGRACDAVILADEEKVRQILLNLLSNAIKFTAEGGAIEIDCGGDATTVRVTVTDSGIGIAEEKLGAIFEPFVQLERKLASTHEGTGLGLSISRNLARAMHGDLIVESTPGHGARFTLSLPRAPGATRAAAAERPLAAGHDSR
jgi:signal transduction histidine kinase